MAAIQKSLDSYSLAEIELLTVDAFIAIASVDIFAEICKGVRPSSTRRRGRRANNVV